MKYLFNYSKYECFKVQNPLKSTSRQHAKHTDHSRPEDDEQLKYSTTTEIDEKWKEELNKVLPTTTIY